MAQSVGLLISCCLVTAAAAQRYSPFSIAESTFEELLPILAKRRAAITALGNSTQQWRTRQSRVLRDLRAVFAPLPPTNRAPPAVLDRGSVQGDGFVFRRLLVETRTGYWAPAGLWLPNNISDSTQIPAVLFPSGHSANSFREVGAQLIASNLCLRGIAVLGYDPLGQGERRMLPDLDGGGGSISNGTEHHSPAFEHEYLQRQSSLLGLNAASLWLTDLTAMLDLLEGLPQVDRNRLGVAGCSGGGVQAAYISAMDDRVSAASIACYESTLAVDYAPAPLGGGGPAEGEQQWGPYVATGALLDKPDLLVARAPKATQVLLTTHDQFFPLAGGLAAVADAAAAFVALGAPGATNLTHTVGVNRHGYVNTTRLALYAFMSQQLLHTRDSGYETPLAKPFSFEQMRVTSTGSVLSAAEINNGHGSLTTHAAFVQPMAAQLTARLLQARSNQSLFVSSVASTVGDVIGFRAPSPADVPVQPTQPGVFLLQGEGKCKVALQVLPRTAESSKPHTEDAVLYVSRRGSTLEEPQPGKLSAVETARVAAIRASGHTVVLVDVCGFGALGDTAGDAFGLFSVPSYAYRVKVSTPVDVAFNVNRSIVAYHAADVMRAANAVSKGLLVGEAPRRVLATLSANDTAAAVLSAALISQRRSAVGADNAIGAVAVVASVASWANIALQERFTMPAYYSFVYGVLRHFDMPDLCGALQGSVAVLGPLDAKSVALGPSAARDVYKFAQQANSRLLVVSTNESSVVSYQILKWLATL